MDKIRDKINPNLIYFKNWGTLSGYGEDKIGEFVVDWQSVLDGINEEYMKEGHSDERSN